MWISIILNADIREVSIYSIIVSLPNIDPQIFFIFFRTISCIYRSLDRPKSRVYIF